jgi:hypothetical protein
MVVLPEVAAACRLRSRSAFRCLPDYLFILSSVHPKMVGLKLFTSIDRFKIMANPLFILAGILRTSGGVAQRMIDFRGPSIFSFPRGERH